MPTATLHTRADEIIDGHMLFTPALLLPWRRKAIHKLLARAEAAGVLDMETVDWLVSTAALERHVWYPAQVEALVAAGLLADDGLVEHQPDCRWYVVTEAAR
jgi:hypothetical protein